MKRETKYHSILMLHPEKVDRIDSYKGLNGGNV